jgi:hypothetical protein
MLSKTSVVVVLIGLSLLFCLQPVCLRLSARPVSHSAVFFFKKNQPNQSDQPDFSPGQYAKRATYELPLVTQNQSII